MRKIAFVIYRDWAYQIYKSIKIIEEKEGGFVLDTLITVEGREFKKEYSDSLYVVDANDNDQIALILKKNKIDVVCYFGWSWLIKEPILSDHICLCLHPSMLPKYRGGSPIQHQIIDGQMESGVTVFKMGEGLDDGDVYQQSSISLEGNLSDVFSRIIDVGTMITRSFIFDFIHDRVIFTPQKNLELYPPLKRRKKEQSEIVLDKIVSYSFFYLNNMVRSLVEPYPNVFFLIQGKKIFLQQIKFLEEVEENSIILNVTTQVDFSMIKSNHFFLKVRDGYALLEKFRVE